MIDELVAAIMVTLCVAVLCVCAFVVGSATGEAKMQQKAVDNGVAEWRVDNKGNPKWQWKENEPKEDGEVK